MSIRQIIREVAAAHHIRPDDITGRSRKRPFAYARQEVMWRARQVRWANGKYRYTLEFIGECVNRRHWTVMWGIAQHEDRVKTVSHSSTGLGAAENSGRIAA